MGQREKAGEGRGAERGGGGGSEVEEEAGKEGKILTTVPAMFTWKVSCFLGAFVFPPIMCFHCQRPSVRRKRRREDEEEGDGGAAAIGEGGGGPGRGT